jgi:hypothetical protein
MKTLYSSLFLSLALVSGTCSAQWLWIDANGTKVYSDQAPPSNIPDKNVLKKPNSFAPVPLEQTQSELTSNKKEAKVTASASSSSANTKLLEAQKEQAERQKKAKADRCKNAKRDLATLNSGVRISNFNDKGEREFMDDKKRSEEVKAKQKTVEADC